MNSPKESTQYLNFIKQYFLILFIGALIGLVGALWLNSQKTPVFIAERFFQFGYTLDNASIVEKEANQVVTVMRSSQLKEELGLQNVTVVAFKPGPFALTLQVKSTDAEASVTGLSKLAGYLQGMYQVREIGTEVFYEEKSFPEKNLLLGILSGVGTGLVLSLILAYFKNY